MGIASNNSTSTLGTSAARASCEPSRHVLHEGIGSYLCLVMSGLDQDIEKLVKACSSCVQVKAVSGVAPLPPWVSPEKPWKRIHLDLAGPLDGRMHLLVVDSHSKWL